MTRTRTDTTLFLVALLAAGCSPASPTTPATPVTPRPPVAVQRAPAPAVEAAPKRKPIDEVEEEAPNTRPKPPAEPMPGIGFGPAPDRGEANEAPPEKDPPIGSNLVPLTKGTKNLFFEKTADGKRRVHVLAEVCLRQGPLEVLLCKAMTKEHESILHADLDARLIHQALIAAGATPGSPAQFFDARTEKEDYRPATGTKIKVTLTYHKGGKLRTDPAQFWIEDMRTKKDLASDWVFAGSRLFKIPDDKDSPPIYGANSGDVISIANFPDSMLDLPVKSPKDDADRLYEAHTDRIPPLRTKVLVTLEPVLEKKAK